MRIVVLTVPEGASELAADRLWTAGAQAVEERTADRGRVELRTSLGSDDAVALVRLRDLPADWAVRFVEVDDAPAQTWREFARPVVVTDRLVIRPAWLEPSGRIGRPRRRDRAGRCLRSR